MTPVSIPLDIRNPWQKALTVVGTKINLHPKSSHTLKEQTWKNSPTLLLAHFTGL